jgi:hypothetical protein
MTSLVLLLAACLAGPSLVVSLAAIGVPWQISGAAVAATALVVLWRTLQQMRAVGFQRLQWPSLLAVLVILGAATFYSVRLSGFMNDDTRVDLSVMPDRAFFTAHSCLSAYTEAARLSTGVNIFDPAQYSQPARPDTPRTIGRFEVDLYQYPPPFLVLPRLAVMSGLEFLTIRRLWFALQSGILFLAIVVTARWIGGTSGLVVLLLAPLIWLAPTTRVTLQIGNFQPTAFALSMLAMIAFERSHAARGGFLLGFATVSNVYPGLLGIVLAMDRPWTPVLWTLRWAAAFVIGATLWIGTSPFLDFFNYQLPRILSGAAFPWIERADVAPINYGIHGLVTKLRLLGVPWTGTEAASHAATLYGVLLLAIAAVSATKLKSLRGGDRSLEHLHLRQAQAWLGLLNLASFRSPFVPDAYALIGTLWLLTLLAAEKHWRAPGRIALVMAAAASMLVLDGGVLPSPVPSWIVVTTLVTQVSAIALNALVAVAPGRNAEC